MIDPSLLTRLPDPIANLPPRGDVSATNHLSDHPDFDLLMTRTLVYGTEAKGVGGKAVAGDTISDGPSADLSLIPPENSSEGMQQPQRTGMDATTAEGMPSQAPQDMPAQAITNSAELLFNELACPNSTQIVPLQAQNGPHDAPPAGDEEAAFPSPDSTPPRGSPIPATPPNPPTVKPLPAGQALASDAQPVPLAGQEPIHNRQMGHGLEPGAPMRNGAAGEGMSTSSGLFNTQPIATVLSGKGHHAQPVQTVPILAPASTVVVPPDPREMTAFPISGGNIAQVPLGQPVRSGQLPSGAIPSEPKTASPARQSTASSIAPPQVLPEGPISPSATRNLPVSEPTTALPPRARINDTKANSDATGTTVPPPGMAIPVSTHLAATALPVPGADAARLTFASSAHTHEPATQVPFPAEFVTVPHPADPVSTVGLPPSPGPTPDALRPAPDGNNPATPDRAAPARDVQWNALVTALDTVAQTTAEWEQVADQGRSARQDADSSTSLPAPNFPWFHKTTGFGADAGDEPVPHPSNTSSATMIDSRTPASITSRIETNIAQTTSSSRTGPDPLQGDSSVALSAPGHVGAGFLPPPNPPPASDQATSRGVPHPLATLIVERAQAVPDGPVTITLRPEELGTLTFEVRQTDTGLHLHLSIDQPATLDLLRRQGDQLLNELRQAGFAGATLSYSEGQASPGGGSGGTAGDAAPRQGTPPATPPAPLVQTTDTAPPTLARAASGTLDLRL